MKTIQKPPEGEYNPFTIAYISLVPNDGLILQYLQDGFPLVQSLVALLPEEKLLHRYEAGKWTIKETLVHMMDTERIQAYRALRIARNDMTPLPGFDQETYTPYLDANERTIENILEEYAALRASTLLLFSNFTDAAWLRTGIASNKPLSVRAAAYIIAGHELHHLKILKEKYL